MIKHIKIYLRVKRLKHIRECLRHEMQLARDNAFMDEGKKAEYMLLKVMQLELVNSQLRQFGHN